MSVIPSASIPLWPATLKTRQKAHTHRVLRCSGGRAVVEGQHDTYTVDIRTLICSCPTPDTQLCSHAMHVIEWQAKRLGWQGAIFPKTIRAGLAELHDLGYEGLPGYRAGYRFIIYR